MTGRPGGALRVAAVDRATLDAFVDAHDGSALQTSAWADAKPGWRAERLVVHDGDGRTVAAALVLHRRLPGVPRTLAYLPEGPVAAPGADPAAVLTALADHARRHGAFALRVGPRVAVRTWSARRVRDGIAAGAGTLADLPPDPDAPGSDAGTGGSGTDASGDDGSDARATDGGRWLDALRRNGFVRCSSDLGDGQPVHVAVLDVEGRTADDLRAGMNQQWRRNVDRALRSGVEVRRAGPADLEAFEDLYAGTARRQHFTPRPRGYLTRLLGVLGDRARLDVAVHDGDVLAGALVLRSGRRVTYLYGASADHDRQVRAANALHAAIAVRAAAEGARLYDLRGVEPVLAQQEHGAGMLRFKAGLGAAAVEYVGEWERPLRAGWHAAYRAARATQRLRATLRRRLR